MDLEKTRHLLRGAASESAFGGDPEILRVAKRGREAPPVAFDAGGGVHQPQVELGVADRQIRDWKPYGVLDVADIVRLSSNIGAAKVAERLGSQSLVEGMRGLGFGSRPGTGFPGESPGLVKELRERQVVGRANLAFGQGLLVSPLQLARAAGILANGGLLVEPRLALAIERAGERVELPAARRERVLSSQTAHTVLAMMRAVVASGTGRGAALARHSVAGKTGTAQKVVGGSYSQEHFVASFVGMVPAERPQLVIVIVLDEPRRGSHTGGAAAAPVFRELAEFAVEHLAIAPQRAT